jgi:drug/metabolite transporter (DMT)-like permease
MRTKVIAYTLAVLSSIFFGLTFLGAKIALTELDPIQVLACRWAVCLVLYLALIAFGVIKVKLRGKAVKWLVLLAMMQPCISQIFETIGIDMITASESAIMYAMIPMFVSLISIVFMKKKIKGHVAVGMMIAFAGIVVSTVMGEDFAVGGQFLGYIIMIAAVIFASIYTVLSEKLAGDFTATERSFALAVIGFSWFNLIMLGQGKGLEAYSICLQHPEVGLAILFLGAAGSFGAYFMFNYAVSHIPASQTSIINTNLLSLTGVVAGILVQGDAFGWYTVVGMIMIIVGVVIANVSRVPVSNCVETK